VTSIVETRDKQRSSFQLEFIQFQSYYGKT